MAFVCPSKESSEQRLKALKDIKEVIESLEKSMTIGVKPLCIPACIPIADYPTPPKPPCCCVPYPSGSRKPKQEPPDVMVCYRVCSKKPEIRQETPLKVTTVRPKYNGKGSKPLELRSGFFVLCGCKRRNGLQDFCPRMECNGSPDCIPFPPRCGPSRFDPTYVGLNTEQRKFEMRRSETTRSSRKTCFKCFPAVCYKICKNDPYNTEQPKPRNEKIIQLKTAKSRELRAGIFYTGCDCCKWSGLQDDCPRTGCHGSPECLINPPICGPSQFCYGKHLGKKKYQKKQTSNSDQNFVDRNTCFKCFPAVVQEPVPIHIM